MLLMQDTADQERASANDAAFTCCSFDLQKVLTTPHGKSTLFFYVGKYAVYNLSFYESKTQNVFCYVYGESDGKRGSNETATIIEKYLLELDERKVREVALYCDNCAGQQKNKIVVTAIANSLSRLQNIKKVSLNILVTGHTMMTVDSLHATIERSVATKTIFAPSEWSTLIINARFNPFPYVVIKMLYTDWRNWKKYTEQLCFPKTTSDKRPFILSAVQRFIFEQRTALEKVDVFYTAKQADGSTLIFNMKKTRRNSEALAAPPRLYMRQLPISKQKFKGRTDLCIIKDLIDLCIKGAIPNYHHQEYFQLPHDITVQDALSETDEEDDPMDLDNC